MFWLRLALLLGWVATTLSAERVRIRVLVTTDLHGYLLPWDYNTAQPAPRGLASIATLIHEARAQNPNGLLIDCGDTIQGSPLEGVYQRSVRDHNNTAPEPMIAAMNALGYDAMVVGNHEFNYGLKNLRLAQHQAKFPLLAANIRLSSAERGFEPWVIKTVRGVKVAVVGLTTPGVPFWETAENYRGFSFEQGVEAARLVLQELTEKHKPDLILIAAHSGLDRDPETGVVRHQDLPGENFVWQLAQEFPQVQAIVFGHTHSQLPGFVAGTALLVQPRNWGMSLGVIDFRLETSETGAWQVIERSSKLVPVTRDTKPDPEIVKLAQPYHDAAEAYLNREISRSPREINAATARVEDSAIVDLIHQVQLAETKADVSFASAFNLRARIPAGALTARQIAALYPYDNTLYLIEGTGKMVRLALENAARYFEPCPGPCTTNRDIPGYNFDTAQGVRYEIDLSRPVGDRVRNLEFRGKPLRDDQALKIAVNNYRAGGSGGYDVFRNAKVIWRSSQEIREVLLSYYSQNPLPEADRNWHLLPAEAMDRLKKSTEAEAAASAGR
jgi:2',3'-cyclic-nucleotide 2'-phosphodiesterase/3'-nucleotidase